MKKFDDIVKEASYKLSWQRRFGEYADEVYKNLPLIKKDKELFHQWKPLFLYMNIGKAKSDLPTFDLRYLGQSVAEIKIDNKEVKLIIDDKKRKNNEDYFGYIANCKETLWQSDNAVQFRKHFSSYPIRNKIVRDNEEHRIESAFLAEIEKDDGANKCSKLHYIQPVKIADVARFQMPTALSFTGGNIIKCGPGHIDVLARVGKGKGTKLCIMELKAYNDHKDAPKDALVQALVYATFIRELLRSDSGQKWWKLFGFNGDLPKELKLYVACVMPSDNKFNDFSISNYNYSFNDGTGDSFEAHYIYFTEKNNKILDVKKSFKP